MTTPISAPEQDPTTSALAQEGADALRTIMRMAEAAKEPCGMDPESPAAIRNGKFASIAMIAAQGLGMVRGPSLASPVPTEQPAGWTLAPDYRGYAHLGAGQYLLNNSAVGDPVELIISIATEEERAGRTVGDSGDNPPGKMIQPEDMCVRLRFENIAGLDALEKQLRMLREEHFHAPAVGASSPAPAEQDKPIGWCAVAISKRSGQIHRKSKIEPSEHHAGLVAKQWITEHDPGLWDIKAIPVYTHPQPATATTEQPKPLDDPRLQGLFGDAIEGALALGFQNSSPPPEGHWLARFWNIGRAEATRSPAPEVVPVSKPPLAGRWHHGEGILCSGSLRIARWDCDTNPPKEFRDRLLDWMCETLTKAQQQTQRAALSQGMNPRLLADLRIMVKKNGLSQKDFDLIKAWAIAAASTPSPAPEVAPVPVESKLREVIERTAEVIERQLGLIADRAPGNYLDKRPVVQSLTLHAKRLRAALSQERGST